MITRRSSIASCVVAATFATVASTAAQTVTRQRTPIVAGPNVHVSRARAELVHYENLAAGDPAHPERMISCIHVYPRAGVVGFEQQCYSTFDRGASWVPTLRVAEGTGNGDPTEAYGRGDTVYVVALVLGDTAKPTAGGSKTKVFRSTDGGRGWDSASSFTFIDREFVTVDRSNGKYGGRVYVVGNGSVQGVDGQRASTVAVYRSQDGGKSFNGPAVATFMDGLGTFGLGTGTVLSDGTLVAMFGATKPGRSQGASADRGPNAEVRVLTSADGGETLTQSVVVASYTADRSLSEGGALGQLAADATDGPFKDRIYIVWPGVVQGRLQINLSYSGDKGKTWSTPILVNDDRSPIERGIL